VAIAPDAHVQSGQALYTARVVCLAPPENDGGTPGTGATRTMGFFKTAAPHRVLVMQGGPARSWGYPVASQQAK
jgi:hypothetical protein